MFLALFLCAQTEHTIGQSYPAGSAQNHGNPANTEPPTGIGMTINKDSSNSQSNAQDQANYPIHSSDFEERTHTLRRQSLVDFSKPDP